MARWRSAWALGWLGQGDLLLARIFWHIVDDPNAKTADRIAAGRFLADRGWGKPAEFVPVEEADPLEFSLPEEAVDELPRELDELAARRAARCD